MVWNADSLREWLADDERVVREPFELLQGINAVVQTHGRYGEGRELVLRALEKRERFAGFEPLLSALTTELGLYPYADAGTLTAKELVAYEFHRPVGLDDGIVFHEVQTRVYLELLSGRNVILSAPTSFGKSLIVDALLASNRYHNIVIVVPTIALIDETRRRLTGRFSGQYRIVTHVSQPPAERNVFIFTQERVVDYEALPQIDLFVIDEFYKLSPGSGDTERSAILNQAFYRLFKMGSQFYMLGPDIRDLPPGLPERLECTFIRSDDTTVVSEVRRVRAGGRTDRERLVELCLSLDEPSLIYCRSPQRVREVAGWLLEAGVNGNPVAVEAAADWLASEFDPNWRVAQALREGIGLHHGRMPRSLAQYMVRAFNGGALRFLVCTSTLIEGVNTSAKNVIIFDNTIARRKYDYFTFNNIRGRSGRMFQHFVGRVYLFNEAPQEELPIVDLPAITQTEGTPQSLLVQLEDEDLTPESRDQISSTLEQSMLSLATIRANAGVDPQAQIELAGAIARNPAQYARLAWSGYPRWEQLEATCAAIWRLAGPNPRGAGAVSARQLAFRINQLRSRPYVREQIRSGIEEGLEPDDAVEDVLEFTRNWAGFRFPRLLRALDRIQKEVFGRLGRRSGDYSFYAALVERQFLPPFYADLEEYGIPIQIMQKLQDELPDGATLDELLESLRELEIDEEELAPFEAELLRDARPFLT